MQDFFEKFGTVYYLRREMQKRAAQARDAVDYLSGVGVFKEAADDDSPNAALRTVGGAALGATSAAGLGAAALYGGVRHAVNSPRMKALGRQYGSKPFVEGMLSRRGLSDGIRKRMTPEELERFNRGGKVVRAVARFGLPAIGAGAVLGGALAYRSAKNKDRG